MVRFCASSRSTPFKPRRPADPFSPPGPSSVHGFFSELPTIVHQRSKRARGRGRGRAFRRVGEDCTRNVPGFARDLKNKAGRSAYRDRASSRSTPVKPRRPADTPIRRPVPPAGAKAGRRRSHRERCRPEKRASPLRGCDAVPMTSRHVRALRRGFRNAGIFRRPAVQTPLRRTQQKGAKDHNHTARTELTGSLSRTMGRQFP